MSQPDANRFAPRPQIKPDMLRERAAYLVNRLEGVKHRLSELRYNITGAVTDLAAGQGNTSGNPAPMPMSPVSTSTMEILAAVGEIEAILTDLEASV